METTTNKSEDSRKAPAPLTELKDWLVESAARCKAMRWLGALFRVEVAQDIVADVEKAQQRAADSAYASEQYDLEAQRELDVARIDLTAALQNDPVDPRVIVDALGRLQQARRMVHLSAQKDHDIAERLTPCTC